MKLTNSQHAVLSAAADHPAQRVEHFPENLKGAARTKVLASLTARGLIREKGKHQVLTKAGLAAIGRELPAPVAAEGAQRRTRENTKQAAVIRMLHRPEGATVRQICETTGWQAHTVRGALAGTFKNKLGLTIISDKTKGGERVYRIS
jgi:predicted transcriptional regulator